MREIIKIGLILLLIASIAAVVLGLSNGITNPVIEEVEMEKSQEARAEVLPEADEFQIVELDDVPAGITEVYEGLVGDEIVGFAIKTATVGYGGNVEVITGISSEGEITGMKVVGHEETPGLGANATTAEFQDQYKGKSAESEIGVVKSTPSNENDIQAITGATITSDAVTKGVNLVIELFNNTLDI
ncbi:RnfABCDGE type electron transport complex subunit G [Clostridium sp. D2Q-14]|uniref:RnfABCDGE type electron transport complex subunit G n=1 Tax=Anaeromonas gelatinilytica TaxID=2683194 RepID=UPI00193B7263|nr:RnfABCDGE type electron transport complex subunit G [Anaeromonas gelatinilytica]MBS4535950.1 RnfABCDGE type electron transport complex subunit G [Anaeromonas gelatinilytica]